MNPFSVSPSLDQSDPAQIGQMSAYFWLIEIQSLHEEANTNFLIADQMQNA